MAASSNERMKDLLTDEDISKVLDTEEEMTYSLKNLMIFG
jgi:hypothetical protein